jgi:hypothetical protein
MLLEEKAEQLATDPEALAKVCPSKLGIAYGITLDKALTLAGQASAIVEHRKSAFSFEEYQDAIRAAKARVIDVTATPAEEA